MKSCEVCISRLSGGGGKGGRIGQREGGISWTSADRKKNIGKGGDKFLNKIRLGTSISFTGKHIQT